MEVCASVLEGKNWTGDGEEVVWTVQIAEQVKNRLKGALGLSARAAPLSRPRAHQTPPPPPAVPITPPPWRAQRALTFLTPSTPPLFLYKPGSRQLCPLQDCGADGGGAAKAAGRARRVPVPVGHGHGQLFHVHLHKRHVVVHGDVLWAVQCVSRGSYYLNEFYIVRLQAFTPSLSHRAAVARLGRCVRVAALLRAAVAAERGLHERAAQPPLGP